MGNLDGAFPLHKKNIVFKTDSWVLCKNMWKPYSIKKLAASRRSSKSGGGERALMKGDIKSKYSVGLGLLSLFEQGGMN